MSPEAIAALVNLGVAGIGLYLFVTGTLRSKSVDEERAKQDAERLAELRVMYDARVALGDARLAELRADRDQWRALALGTEQRLDRALPTVASAIGVPLAQPPEAGT